MNLKDQIAALERRVAELEKAPRYYPVYVPYVPVQPIQPHYPTYPTYPWWGVTSGNTLTAGSCS